MSSEEPRVNSYLDFCSAELPRAVLLHTYFTLSAPHRPRALRIYECHIGLSSEEQRINSYMDFRMTMLPRIRKLGYNAIQIMALQEHAYYGSFGYHVTNFFAVRSPNLEPGYFDSNMSQKMSVNCNFQMRSDSSAKSSQYQFVCACLCWATMPSRSWLCRSMPTTASLATMSPTSLR